MKKFNYILIFIFAFILFNINCLASNKKIVLNTPETDDVNHTFKYSKLEIDNSVSPCSLTLSIENGYFNTNNTTLNDLILTYFDFKGGTDTSNNYKDTLDTVTNYKTITFNLKSTVDLDQTNTKQFVVASAQKFLRNILFHNDTNKDAKFTLSFSELEMKLKLSNNTTIPVVAFKPNGSNKTHYYAKIDNTIDWKDAYNIAVGLKWNNLQGYLLTLTSEEEHNFIYNSLGSIEGWMGAASIENADSITFNTSGIEWDDATDILGDSVAYKEDEEVDNDALIENYWYWVSGPEAGTKVFTGYNNFNDFEPNNFCGEEWVAEYGYGTGGKWNDYSNGNESIEGYYIEFGGFEDDNPTVTPVSLTNTFRWTDYDFRNVEDIINDKIKDIVYDENTDLDEIEDLIEEAIRESQISGLTSRIINNKTENNLFSYDIELSIGEGDDEETYIIHIKKQLPTVVENPKTSDNIINYIIMLLLSGIILMANKKIIKNNL